MPAMTILARAHVPLGLCLLALARAEEPCSGDDAACAVEQEDVGLLQVGQNRRAWTRYDGHNCYDGGHGASTSDAKGLVSGYPQCESKCSGYDGLVLDSLQTTCWCIKGIDLSKCIKNSPYTTYVKGGGSSPPSPSPPSNDRRRRSSSSYCAKPCTFATELSDCGGECGLCDGQLCIKGSPPSDDRRRRSSSSGSWTLKEGYNCYDGGHGASTSDAKGLVSGYPQCESKCSGYDGLVLDSLQTTCWCIKGIDLSKCIKNSPYSTYVK